MIGYLHNHLLYNGDTVLFNYPDFPIENATMLYCEEHVCQETGMVVLKTRSKYTLYSEDDCCGQCSLSEAIHESKNQTQKTR